ncbi:glycoside hydrolase family 108 protein [Microbulbifer hydrolyticus]|uniref:Lysozyme family protein n=1 Tax=Microbulbifer hydrolyticus TaxID=48074 RepID=A0A6P1TCK1_9GAMM|nr:N-acetylmuramidase [Microbulbifer hydrolyticus]MBB5210116.1 lysozyme family protein [Microbulbifer hydrolyticus]QHQ39366.1 N-acetylmuramidase [Microbulbifer hydrolyticus]
MANFLEAVEKTIIREGGSKYTNDKDDPGGETKFGISKRAFPDLDIKNLTKPQAEDTYKTYYWDKIFGDQIQSQIIAENYFDTAVNMGAVTATKLVQVSLELEVDGIIGPNTLAALNNCDESLFLSKFTISKISRYASICNNDRVMSKYLLGWINRTLETTT